MNFKDKVDQIYDWLHSIHNMIIGIMLIIGLGVGIWIWKLTNAWIAIPLCFVGTFAYPLADNIVRRIMHKNNNKKRGKRNG